MLLRLITPLLIIYYFILWLFSFDSVFIFFLFTSFLFSLFLIIRQEMFEVIELFLLPHNLFFV